MFNFDSEEELLMNTCPPSAGRTKCQPQNCPGKDGLSGHRLAFGFIFFRPKAWQYLCHSDVFGAILRHLSGSCGELSLADVADEFRPVHFLTEHSSHFGFSECLQLSAFRDCHGTKFYLVTLTNWTTVVSLPEEF